MRSIALAFALAAGATAALAQDMAVPKHKCEKPEMVGPAMMKDTSVRRRFDSQMKTYETCIRTYVDERKSAIKSHEAAMRANETAGNDAINEYNATMKQMQDAHRGEK